jgi:hypothetical protein
VQGRAGRACRNAPATDRCEKKERISALSIDDASALAAAQAELRRVEAELRRLLELFGRLLDEVREAVPEKVRKRDLVIRQQAQVIQKMRQTTALAGARRKARKP